MLLTCPDCGKLISSLFPMHDCVPTKNFKAKLKANAKVKRIKKKK